MRTILVFSAPKYDKSATVHRMLDAMHKSTPICIVAHLGRGAGAYASAWTRVARPYVSEFVSRAELSQTAVEAILESNIDEILVFGKTNALKSLKRMARKRKILLSHIE